MGSLTVSTHSQVVIGRTAALVSASVVLRHQQLEEEKVETREVVRCDFCSLVQYMTKSCLCRKCRRPIDFREEVIPSPPGEVLAKPSKDDRSGEEWDFATVVRRRRRNLLHLSQPKLARRMGVPRTYISKIENGKVLPTLLSLERLAQALDMELDALIRSAQKPRVYDLSPLECQLLDAFRRLKPRYRSRLSDSSLTVEGMTGLLSLYTTGSWVKELCQ